MSHIGEILSAPRVDHHVGSMANTNGGGLERATKFDTTARIRFLDCLASTGNVRAAAARVGVSRETAYRTRRRDAAFMRLWDAALVHARSAAEAELATRALDGVPMPVYARGEHVATWHRQDTRLLLAHLGRLDAKVLGDRAARTHAEFFDQRLAAMAGHAAPDDFAEATADRRFGELGGGDDAAFIPDRTEYAEFLGRRAADAADEPEVEDDECDDDPEFDDWEDDDDADDREPECVRAAREGAASQALQRYDWWDRGGIDLLDRILRGEALGEPGTDAADGGDGADGSGAQDRVTCVNRAARRRAMKAQKKAERKGRGKRSKAWPPSSKLR